MDFLGLFSWLLWDDVQHDFERAADAKKQEEIKNLLTDVKSRLDNTTEAKKQEQAQHPHSGVLNPEDPSQITLPKKLSLDSVEAFREVMRKDEPALQILREKGINTQQVENIADYCKNFADGVEYAAKKYGTKPSAIFIEQNKEPSLDVNPENGSITITTGFLHNVSQQTYIDEPKTRPYALKRDDSAFLSGVEEAFHLHVARVNPALYADLVRQEQKIEQNIAHGGVTPPYNDRPLEHPAVQAVREAAADRGILQHSPINTIIPAVRQATAAHDGWANAEMQRRFTEQVSQAPGVRMA